MDDRNKQLRGAFVALPYFDGLGRFLTVRELRRYLWSSEMDESALRKAAGLWRHSVQGRELYGLRPPSPIALEENEQLVARHWQWVRGRLWLLQMVPFVELVMVMNGLAHGVVSKRSDIDLFIVATQNRVWTARGWMLMWLTLMGARARGGENNRKFSPEFFVDVNHMGVGEIGSASAYLTAFWLADFVPILYPQNFSRFRLANSWLMGRLPVAYRSPANVDWARRRKSGWARFWEVVLSGGLGDRIESAVAKRQKSIIERNLGRLGKKTDFLITNHVVKVHFDSRRPEVVERAVAQFLEQSS